MIRIIFSRIAGILAGAFVIAASAVHPKNAGPADFEIKFKLPPPKPLTPEEAMKAFKIAPGFRIELVAAEPMIETPVAMSWDDRGRLFVLEMIGYMQDAEGKGEDQQNSRVVILEDTNGDGKMDKRTVFADGLVLPRALMCVNGGALVAEPPVLWFMKDTDGDGKADVKEQVDGSFGSRTGQPEHMANSPTWTLDNWIYSANHATRYRFSDGKFTAQPLSSRGQWGMTQDDYGRLFYNFNSDFLRANFVPEHFYKRNPNFPCTAGVGVQVMKDQSVWPAGPTPGVNRGYEKGSLREDGSLTKCTATCGAVIYRGGLFSEEFAGNAFIPEPSANLLKRVIIDEKDAQLTARNAYTDKSEFLTSTDERFRPVTAYVGPDGALYLADMYRGVIQHKGFLTHYLVANIKDRNLEAPVNMGRIWRIVPEGREGAKAPAAKLPQDAAGLVSMLSHANGWVRDTAQRVLVERKDASVAPALAKLAADGSPKSKLHALWTLEGIGGLTPDIIKKGFADADPKVRANAVRLADRTLLPEIAKLAGDPAVDVQVAAAFALSTFPEGAEGLAALVRKAGKNLMVRDAAISGLRGRELEFLEMLLADKTATAPDEILSGLGQAVVTERRTVRVQKLLALLAMQPEGSPAQLALLAGASGKTAVKGTAKDAPKVKIIYFDAQPPELAKIVAFTNPKAKPLATALDARIAWPGKPGVPPPPVIKPLDAGQQKLFEIGKTTYATLCAACHQPNGAGQDGLAPTLIDSEWVIGRPEVLPRIIIHGLSGPIKVNGTPWSLEMPPLGAALTDEQVAGVSTYIRREWEHGASPVSVDFVKQIRESNKTRTKAWAAEELIKFMKEDKKSAPTAPKETTPATK
jgi:mono/diheme cytochrome c family protein/glucose/arabinose dehydrogenase